MIVLITSKRAAGDEKRGGCRETAGRLPGALSVSKTGSTRRCKRCGLYVAKSHYHSCGEASLKTRALRAALAACPKGLAPKRGSLNDRAAAVIMTLLEERGGDAK